MNRILTFVFASLSIVLGIYLFRIISTTIRENDQLKAFEHDIVTKLMMVREVQHAYKSEKGSYGKDWDALLNFVDTGRFHITQRTETIVILDYGADSTSLTIDTLGTIMVRDSLFKPLRYPDFDLEELPYVPHTDPKVKFDVWAGKIKKGNVIIDVVEVWNPQPIDPGRHETNSLNSRKPLRFGSRENVSTSGNWE